MSNRREISSTSQLSNLLLNKDFCSYYEKVKRWDSPFFSELNPNFKESDLEHVLGMKILAQNIKTTCPYLTTEVNMNQVSNMIDLHDVGEIQTQDILANGRNDNSLTVIRQRQQEAEAAQSIIIYFIKGDEQQQNALNLYFRFEKQTNPSFQTDDKEALLARFIDKLQGDIVFFKNYIDPHFNSTTNPLSYKQKIMIRNNIENSLPRVFNPALHFLKLLKNPRAKAEFTPLINFALNMYQSHEYVEEVNNYLKNKFFAEGTGFEPVRALLLKGLATPRF